LPLDRAGAGRKGRTGAHGFRIEKGAEAWARGNREAVGRTPNSGELFAAARRKVPAWNPTN